MAQFNTAEQIQQYAHPVLIKLLKHELRNIPLGPRLPGRITVAVCLRFRLCGVRRGLHN